MLNLLDSYRQKQEINLKKLKKIALSLQELNKELEQERMAKKEYRKG